MIYLAYLLTVVEGYLLGCSNMAYYIAKLRHVDIRSRGSKNLGASNAAIVLGWKAGILVAAHDIGKAVLAVYLAKWVFPAVPYIGAVAGVSAVLGHIFPVFLKFKGGKGFASYLGMTIALNWKLALVILAAVVLVTLVTDYIVCGTFTTIVAVPTYLALSMHSWVIALILGVGTAVIFLKHRENIVRLINHTEIGLRSTARGEHRA